jgi:unsaturated rhamnogalacturonyl hydrolase
MLARIGMGWLDETYKNAINRALISVMPSIQAYDEIPCYPTLYGQGSTLILLSLAIKDRRG